MEEDLARRGPAREARLFARQQIRDISFDGNALARKRNSRCDQVGKREFLRAVFCVRECETGDGAGHADRERGVPRFGGVGFPVRVEKTLARDRRRRGLAVIDGGVEMGCRQMDHHVAAAADIARARIGHGQRKAGRDGGIHGIAPLLEDRCPDAGGARFLCHHHAVARDHRRHVVRNGGRRIEHGRSLPRCRRE